MSIPFTSRVYLIALSAVTLAKTMKITVIVVALVYTIVALISLMGYVLCCKCLTSYLLPNTRFIGAILRKYRFIKTFFIMLAISLAFQLATGIWYLVTFYTTRNQSLADCLDGTNNQTKIDYCNSLQVYKTYPQGYVIANVIVPILLQLCEFFLISTQYSYHRRADACYIIRAYSRYLEREHAEKDRQFHRVPGPVYQPIRHDETYPLSTGYPYAAPPNSFGHKV